MTFDPSRVPEETCVEGHLDSDPIYDVLLSVHGTRVTGRLTVDDGTGPNHLYFMQGRPVGVALAEYVHPLGQLLLELGRVDGRTFVRAQRRIAESNRLAGQVFKELGVVDEDGLREVLTTQARRKAEHFCRLGSRPFTFCRGLTYLSGFTSTPMDLFAVVFLAVRAQLGADARAAWIEGARSLQVRVTNAPGDEHGLPAPLAVFGFGAAEERFLQRIVGGWERVSDLVETGTLPPDEAALLLRFLEVLGRLERRQPPAAVPAQVTAVTRAPELGNLAVPDALDDVFSSSGPARRAAGPAPITAVSAPPPSADSVFSAADSRTDPKRRSIHDEATIPLGDAEPTPVNVQRPAGQPARFKSVLFPEQNAPPPPTLEELPPPVVKKKKVKRTEPLPSETSGLRVSETRKEKTNVGPMPTIVIDED